MVLIILFVFMGLMLGPPPAQAASPKDCDGKVVLSFPLAAETSPKPAPLGRSLLLSAERYEQGWDLVVSRSGSDDNLLAPTRNWHGAQSFQVSVYLMSVYPNERIIPIRSTSSSICVRILNARTEGAGNSEHFVNGEVEVRWSGQPSR